MRYTISSLFLSIYIIIIYMLLTRHATIADYFTTIRRLFRDCPATIPGMRREPCGNLRTVPERACRLSGWQIWQQERRAALARRAAGSAEDLRARARTRAAVSRRCGECLYLRRNCPLNARLHFRSILYAININTPYTHDFGGVSRRCRKSPRKTRAHSTEPEAEKSPGRLRAYRGGCSFGVFRRVNEYQERHEQDIKQHQAPSTSSRSISSRSQSSGAWGWRVTTPPRAMRSISRVSRV